jgi:hypothetical protein
MKRRPGVWIVAFLPLLGGCAHAVMMGGMGLGMGIMGHHRGATNCRREASAMETHLQHSDTTRSEMLAAIVPVHTRRLEALLDACVPRASDASSSADTMRAKVAALREDLTHVRQLGASELGAFMPEHNARIHAFLNLLGPAAEEHSP